MDDVRGSTRSPERTSFFGLFGSKDNVWFLGAVFMQVWFSHVNGFSGSQPELSSELFYAVRGLVPLIVAALFMLFKCPRKATFFNISWGCAVLMCGVSIVFALDVQNTPLLVACIIVAGIGLSWCSLQYAYIYSFLSPKRIAFFILIFFSIANIMNLILSFFPDQIGLYVTCSFPLFTVFFASKSLKRIRATVSTEVHLERPGDKTASRSLFIIAVELAIYGIVVGIIRGFSTGIRDEVLSSVLSTALVLVMCLLLYFLFVRSPREIDIVQVCQVVFVVLLTAIVLISFAQGAVPEIGIISSWIVRIGLIILLWLVLVGLASRSAAHPFVVFGFGYGLYMLAIMTGMLIGGVADIASQQATFFLNLAYLLAISFVIAIGLYRRRSAMMFGKDDEGAPVSVVDRISIEEACAALGVQRGLSDREVEILEYICKGRSKAYIAEQIHLSENTVKYHAKRLYMKLDIHSRQELMSLVGIE